MAPRGQTIIQSEREAWAYVQRIAARVRSTGNTDGQLLGLLADQMLEQLDAGVHENPKRNPSIAYGQALGGRIRGLLGDTPLVHRVTHGLMTSRLDTVKTHDAESLVKLLERQGHQRTAGQFATFWNKHAVRGG